MKIVVQRSKAAQVTVDDDVVGRISHGLVLLVGITHEDSEADAELLANKITHLRIFDDEDGKMNRSLLDAGGQVLSISQFTLYADCRKGRRPSYVDAARPDQAEPLYNYFNAQLAQLGVHVETGRFGANMAVQLTNDGPVTIIIDSDELKGAR